MPSTRRATLKSKRNMQATANKVNANNKPAPKRAAALASEKENAESLPPSPQMAVATPTRKRSKIEDAMTVEAYLRQECEKTIERVLAHAEARITQFEANAKRVRAEISELLEASEA